MQKLNYKLIVSDFDGTLVNENGTISDKNKKAIADYMAAGGAFAISTGRMPDGILSRAKELGLKGLVSCCQGSIIADIETRNFVFEDRISYETTLAVVEQMEQMGLHIFVYESWEYFSNKDNMALKMYENAVKSKATLVIDKPLSAFVKERKLASYKILVMVSPEDNERVLKALEAEHFPGCAVTRSSEFLVEVINSKYSKGTAVEFLVDYFHTTLEETVAIGDQLNDLPMIEKAGFGIAVQNADKGLKAKAKTVSPRTNEEGAVAWAIEQFGFQK
ncbi:MAG: HAD family phosphatase [Clostridia bacterium]|nr:HAD family phosphatase [Clostridia bacterium]